MKNIHKRFFFMSMIDNIIPVSIALRETTIVRISQSSQNLTLTRDLNLIVCMKNNRCLMKKEKEFQILGGFATNGSSLGLVHEDFQKESFLKIAWLLLRVCSAAKNFNESKI